MFPKQRKHELDEQEITHCLQTVLELTQGKGALLLLLKQNDDSAIAWSGDLNTQDMIRLCALGIHDAYTLETQEEEVS